MCVQKPQRYEAMDSQVTEAYMLSWGKEKEVGVWGFQGEKDNSKENSNHFVNISRQVSLPDVKTYLW